MNNWRSKSRSKTKSNSNQRVGLGPSRRTKRKVPVRSKIFKHFKIGILAGVSVLIATVVLTVVVFYNFLNAPFSKASDNIYFKDTVLDSEESFVNIAVILTETDQVNSKISKFALFSISDKESDYQIYDYPVSEPFKLISHSGEREVTLEDLQLFANNNNFDFLTIVRDFFVNYLAVPVNGYVIISQNDYKEIESLYGTVDFRDLAVNLRLKNTLKLPKAIYTFRSNAKTNLSMSDVLGVINFIKNTPNSQGRLYSVSRFELLDHDKWDYLWQENLGISEIKKEGIKVFVLNASNPKIPGLAQWGTRLAKNLGAGMLGTDNSFTDFQMNTIITESEDLKTVKEFGQIFPEIEFKITSDLPVSGDYNSEIFRTKVTLVLTSY